MSTIHLIGGEKGGVGKSLVSRLLAQYFIDRELPFTAFDTDRSHGALLRFYTHYAAPVQLDRPDGLDGIVEAAAANPERRVLVDLAAQTTAALAHWLDESGVLDVTRDLGVGLRYWHVMDAGRDSVNLLATLLSSFGATVPLVIVLNEVRGDNFELLKTSGQLERAQAFGAHVMPLRKLHESTMQKIDGQNTSFWAAVNHSERATTGLGLLERQRVRIWLQRAYVEMERVGA
jgi:CobQ/CobB/MinD/ParA nucleotide binding domain